MKIKSNQIRTITIEGVKFTPDSKGVVVPDNKVKAVKDNFFFKTLLEDGSFVEVKEPSTNTRSSKEKAE